MIQRLVRQHLAGCVVTLCAMAVVLGAQNANHTADNSARAVFGLSPCQSAQADVLQLRQLNGDLRRTVLNLQIQVEQLRAPAEQRAVEEGWKALEHELGCAVDRQTRECRSEKETKK